jgi:predicted AAA+ superfamily ATPase
MFKRKIESTLESFRTDIAKKALLITGARQTGKTYSVRKFAQKNYDSFIEINFINSPEAIDIFQNVTDEQEILLRISAFTTKKLIPGNTLIFFDEIQVCPEAVTYVKFLVEDGRFRYILSGSLLGVELKNIRSVPVGFLTEYQMYPLDFYEFIKANDVNDDVIEHLKTSFSNGTTPDPVIHSKMIKYLSLYLVVGGMPAVVKTYLLTNDLQKVYEVQRSIIKEYMRDVTQYDARLKMHLRNIYSLIPSELKKPNKRFYLKNILDENRFKNTESDFVWLKEAGIAIPVFNVDIPQMPLELAKKANIFKLFLNDVGLLCSLYMDGIQLKILTGELDFNGGAVWENFVAQELLAHGFETLYYYNSKKCGKVDFLINFQNNLTVLEIKSGKDFKSHTALNKVINSSFFDIPQAFVLSKSNDVEFGNKITYYPIYFLMFIEKTTLKESWIYKVE